MAGFTSGLLGFQQATDDYYKNLPTDAMLQGQQAENIRQQQQMAAQIERLATAIPMYNPEQFDLGRRIIAAKTAYDQAVGNAEEQARQHEIAEGVRQYAAKNGIDLSAYDANNVNTNQAQNNYSMAVEAARRNLMNSETADEFYTRRRNELMAGGLSEKRAMDQAAREMQEYRAKRAHAYNNLFYDQGTTNNAINNAGAYALASLMSEDPGAANLYTSLYAHPVDDYKQDWAKEQALFAADIANNKAMLGNALAIARDNNNFNNSMALNASQFAQALQKMGLQNQFAQENAARAGQNQIQQVADVVNMVKQYSPDMSDEDAFYTALNILGGGKGGKQSRSGGNISDAQARLLQSYESNEAAVEDMLAQGEAGNPQATRGAILRLEDSVTKVKASGAQKDLIKNIEARVKQYKEKFKDTYGEEFESGIQGTRSHP